jgi:hypothetical protein
MALKTARRQGSCRGVVVWSLGARVGGGGVETGEGRRLRDAVNER